MTSTSYEPITRKLFENKLLSFTVRSLLIGGYVLDDNTKLQLAMCVFYSFAVCLQYFWGLGQMLNFLQEDMEELMINADEREKQMFEETCKFMFNVRMAVYTPTVMAACLMCINSLYRILFDQESINNYAITHSAIKVQSLVAKTLPFRLIHDDFFFGIINPIFMILTGSLYIPLWPVSITNLMSYVNFKWKIMHKRMSEMDISKVILEPNEVIIYSSIVNENDKTNYLRAKLCKFFVKEQIRIRWFMDQLQKLIRIPVFMDFMIYSIIMCFILYEMAAGDHTKTDLAFLVLFEIIIAIILWVYHWNGTLVNENSYAMCFAIYSSDWYTYSINVQKMVLLIMIISADPMEITAFVIRLHVTTFIDIVRAAFSYFNILRTSVNQ